MLTLQYHLLYIYLEVMLVPSMRFSDPYSSLTCFLSDTVIGGLLHPRHYTSYLNGLLRVHSH